MKYITFDYKSLIKDFRINQNAVMVLETRIHELQKELEDPFRDNYADVTADLAHANLKLQEYQMYVDMVVLGFGALSEEERRILELNYFEGHTNQECADLLYMSLRDFDRKKARALRHFLTVVYP